MKSQLDGCKDRDVLPLLAVLDWLDRHGLYEEGIWRASGDVIRQKVGVRVRVWRASGEVIRQKVLQYQQSSTST